MSPFFAEARQRLMRRVTIDPVTGCWLYQGSHSGTGRGGGYGRITYKGQTWAAHRLSFVAWKGPIPKGRQAGHTCPCNPPPRNCINPDHLGTARAILEAIPFGLRQGRIVRYLADHYGKWVRTEDLVNAVWFDDPNGGPDHAGRSLASQINFLRRRLRPHGLVIEWHAGGNRRIVLVSEEARS